MKIGTEEIADREVALTLEPEQERVEKATRRVARALAGRVKIPGFRPGKAPFQVVERAVGREYLLEEVANELASELYEEALEETGLEPYTKASVEIVSLEPMSLKVSVALVPEVDLGDYRAIRVEAEGDVAVTDEQVQEAVHEVQERLSEWIPVERAAEMGDQVVMDVLGKKNDETVANSEGDEFILSEDSSPPGFSAELVGLEAGESKEFTITYPDDFPEEDVRGEEVGFTVTLGAVRERDMPPIDDDLAKSAGDYDTLEELRQTLRDKLQARLEEEARDRLGDKAIEALIAQAKVTYPAAALQHEIDDTLAAYEKRLEGQGFTLDGYLGMTGQTQDELRQEMESGAKERLVRALVLAELVKAEEIEVEDGDVAEEVDRLSSAYGEQAESVKRILSRANALSTITSDLYTRKATDRLIAVATGQAEAQVPEEQGSGAGEGEPKNAEQDTAVEMGSEADDSSPEAATGDAEGKG